MESEKVEKKEELVGNIIIDIKGYEVELRRPLFIDFRMASQAYNNGDGDLLAAGSSLVQYCWVKGDEKIKNGDESKDAEIANIYTALCLEAYHSLFKIYKSEIKKK